MTLRTGIKKLLAVYRPECVITAILALLTLIFVFYAPRVRTPFFEGNCTYLEQAQEKTVAMLVPVSIITGVLDVVEGSTVDGGISLGMTAVLRVEAGDIVQPLLNIMTVMFKMLLVNAGYVTAMMCLLKLANILAMPLVILALFTWLISRGVAHHASVVWHAALQRTVRFFALWAILLAVIFPCAVRATRLLSDTVTQQIMTERQEALTVYAKRFNVTGTTETDSTTEMPYKLAHIRQLIETARYSCKYLGSTVCTVLAIFVLEGLVFPFLSLLFLIYFTRSCLFPVLKLSDTPTGVHDVRQLIEAIRDTRETRKTPATPEPTTPNEQRTGSALVVAIWTIAVLSLMVLSFALDAKLESRVNVYVRQRTHVDHLTQAGVTIAEYLLLNYSSVSDAGVDEDLVEAVEKDKWIVEKRNLKHGSCETTFPVDEQNPESGTVTVSIRAVEAKWNVNLLYNGGTQNYDEIWEAIFTAANIPQERWEELIDSWSDWRDTDHAVSGRDGAETDYYEEKFGYTARDGEIANIDELAMVKGFSKVILTGGILNPEAKKDDQITVTGLNNFLDVYGSGKINVNSAGASLLSTVPGIDGDAELAGAIVEERTKSFGDRATDRYGLYTDWNDLNTRLPIGLETSANNYLSYQPEEYFEVTITGASAGIAHSIRAIAMVSDKTVRFIRWQEDP